MVSVGEIHSGRRLVVELLTLSGDGVGDVDDVEDLGAAEAGDPNGTERDARGSLGSGDIRSTKGRSGPEA